MKILTANPSLLFVASTITISYDTGYDEKSCSMTAVACSDRLNSLIIRYGWTTQHQIPRFPYAGGSSKIAGCNAKQCGTCQVTCKGKTTFVLGLDHAGAGIDLSKTTMDKLAKSHTAQFRRVDATVTKVGISRCGLTPERILRLSSSMLGGDFD